MILRLAILLALAACATTPQPQSDPVESLLSRMTLEEKLGQLTGFASNQPDLEALVAAGRVGMVFSVGPAETETLQRAALERSRLKIPLLIGNDVIHGYRTIFPIPLAIAGTWDPEMAELSARIAAGEARAAGTHWTFSPMVDIARDPRWGRIAEGAGEDPFLGAAMAAAYVRGFQGNNLLACAKHYVGYGAAEAGRDYNSVDMSERMLRQVYLPPFRAAVDEGVATIMTAFNALNGLPSSGNRHTLDEILRREWKFRGVVVSDYRSVLEMIKHGVAASPQEAAMQAITAGVDVTIVDDTYATLAAAVRDGRLEGSVVDEAVRRVLRAKFRAGLSDAAAVTPTRESLEAARRIAQRSIVLLKNDGPLLPLSSTAGTIALIGPLADNKKEMLGSWAAAGEPEEAVSVREGLTAKGARLLVAKGTDILEGTKEGIAEAVEIAKQADLVIAALGEAANMTGEASSRVSLDLPAVQQQLLEAIVATGKPVVLVVMSGRPLTIGWAAENVPAIVWSWFLGTQAGHALADVLFGEVNPGGKLPVTFPRSVGQVPIYYSHLNTGRPPNPSDKYTSKYLDSPNEPLFPFGYGLSYTRFQYDKLTISAPSMAMDGKLTVSAEVRNAGDRSGEEVVQFYVNDPVASVSRPVKELRGFQRVALAPGEAKQVEFTIDSAALQFWSDSGWKVEPGTFNVWIGPSSTEGLQGRFELRESK